MIHVVITVTDLTRRGLFFDVGITERGRLPESYSSQECLSQA